MVYISQEKKKELAPGIKNVLKKYNMKGSISVADGKRTLVVTLSKGPINFVDYLTKEKVNSNKDIIVNTYYIKENFNGIAKDFLLELIDAMMVGNYNNSDIMTDYFNEGWYIEINIGKWNNEYIYEPIK